MEISFFFFFFFLNIASDITKCDTALITKSENQLCSTKNTLRALQKIETCDIRIVHIYIFKKEKEEKKYRNFLLFHFFPYTVPFMNRKKNLD